MLERFRNLTRAQQILVGGGAAAVVAAIIAVVAVAVGGGDSPTTTTGPTTTTTLPPPAPLTGLPAFDEDVFSRPAISVKLGNNPDARPQAGLNAADVVYEEEVEGRITRFLVVFHSTEADRVGPIRSVRLMDGLIARPIGGIFVFSGGQNVPERVQRLEEAGLRHFDEDALQGIEGAQIIDRDHGNGVRPNILFTSLPAIWETVESETPPDPIFSYLPDGQEFEGEDAPAILVPVGPRGFNPTWRYDEERDVWERFYGEEPFETKDDDQAVADNLIVQFVERQGEESIVVGEGEAVIAADGKIVRGTWSRSDPDQPTQYFDEAGNEIAIPPGRTWVHLPLAGSGSVTVLDSGGGNGGE